MNKFVKKGFCLVLATGLIASTFAGCAKIDYVTSGAIKAIHEIKDGSWQNTESQPGAESGTSEDTPLVEFTPGTYGGKEFKTIEDVAKYYVEAYNYTKTLTAEYINEDGGKETFYKLLGDENIVPGDVMIDGKANAIINKLVPTIVGGIFKPNTYGLPPCNNRNPLIDNTNSNEADPGPHDFRTSALTADDILAANIVDNKDGTITMTIQPKACEMSVRGEDAQGKFFEVLGDIGAVVKDIDIISFEQGTADDNVKVTYKGGTGKVKINTSTNEIVEADYEMIADVAVTHATVKVIKDKSASLKITYTNHYPADDDYLKAKKGLTRVK